MKNILFIALVAILATTSCHKHNGITNDFGNRWTMLVSKHWIISSREVNGVSSPITDCKRDNYYVFDENGLGRWEEGAVNCFDTVSTNGGGNNGGNGGSNGNGGGNGGGTNGGGSDSSNKTTVTNPVQTYTEFTWSMTGDQRAIYMKNFGRTGYNPEWTIEDMKEDRLDVRSVEHIDGAIVVYNLHLVPTR
ncbi:MAG: hypothetical protein JST82_05595 [Bacteroidetes bacterium]|nr:hypothetical protein [Bacteroidota bacterium]